MPQSATVLPTTGTFSGLTEQGYINAAMAALASNNSGGSAPTATAPVEGQFWADTSVSGFVRLWVYTGSVWLLEGALDLTDNIWGPPVGGGVEATIASATTTDLWSVTNPGAPIEITGTTTIAALANSSAVPGTRKMATFGAALTLTHNATSLILPNAGSNIVTAAGDWMEVLALTASHVAIIEYSRASGAPVNIAGQRVLLNTLTASSSASLSDTTSITGAYSVYELEFIGVAPASSGVSGQFLFYAAGSYVIAGYYVGSSGNIGNAHAQAGTLLPFPDGFNYVVPTGGIGLNGRARFYPATGLIEGSMAYVTGSLPGVAVQKFSGWCGAGGISGFKFQFSSGNIASGTINIFGSN
jgi:hypothetical protein